MVQSLDEILSKAHGTPEERSEFFTSYINSRGNRRRVLNKAMGSYDFAALVRHAYDTVWGKKYNIPELITRYDIRDTIGSSINEFLDLLRKTQANY